MSEASWGKTNGKLVVGVCYRPPNLMDEEETDLLSQIEMAARQPISNECQGLKPLDSLLGH